MCSNTKVLLLLLFRRWFAFIFRRIELSFANVNVVLLYSPNYLCNLSDQFQFSLSANESIVSHVRWRNCVNTNIVFLNIIVGWEYYDIRIRLRLGLAEVIEAG